MSKKYLGFICFLYSGIILYVWLFDKLNNYLAPQMQIYLKISVVPMLIVGLVLLFNSKVTYKFKISDIVLLLPLIMLILAGDGRFAISFASNRTVNYNTQNRSKSKTTQTVTKVSEPEEINNEPVKKKIEEEKEEPKVTYDFSNPDFEVVDANYAELANYITFSSKADKYSGKTIKVRGMALQDVEYISDDYFMIGKYLISCCAADASFTGFVVKYDGNKIESDKWYDIEGILEKGVDEEGYDIMYIKIINIKEINGNSELQYVYPCYSYGDGTCKELMKYDLEY